VCVCVCVCVCVWVQINCTRPLDSRLIYVTLHMLCPFGAHFFFHIWRISCTRAKCIRVCVCVSNTHTLCVCVCQTHTLSLSRTHTYTFDESHVAFCAAAIHNMLYKKTYIPEFTRFFVVRRMLRCTATSLQHTATHRNTLTPHSVIPHLLYIYRCWRGLNWTWLNLWICAFCAAATLRAQLKESVPKPHWMASANTILLKPFSRGRH